MALTLTYIRWKDACYRDVSDNDIPELWILEEVGFLLGETEEAVLIAMEHAPDGTGPGRWRINIPKVNIIERKDVPFESVFGIKKIRRPRKKKEVEVPKP